MPKQKFARGDLVHIGSMPREMSHFDCNLYAIVRYSYRQRYGGSDTKNYNLILLKDGKPFNSVSWYREGQLTLITRSNNKLIAKMERFTDGVF